MSDGAPGPALLDPVPLPLPPGAAGTEPPRRGRIALIIAAVVTLVLALCGLSVAGVIWLATAGPDLSIPGPAPGPPVGVHAMKWAGGSRYVVVEYESSGVDATTSVIAWDSKTGSATKLDGFRLVATEASSTQVWLARAARIPTSADESFSSSSPWDEPSWGLPDSDGPGDAYSWDAAHPERQPEYSGLPRWETWPSPDSRTAAYLSADPEIGLWPGSLAFDVRSALTDAYVSEGRTFLPVGWSPSGRYFAVFDDNSWSGMDARLSIFDSTSGSEVASYETSQSADGETFEQLKGVAWDPATDVLWVCTETATGAEAIPSSVFALSPQGTRTPVIGTLHDPGKVVEESTLIGRDGAGVLLYVQSSSDRTLWRIESGVAVKVGPLPGTYFGIHPDAYRDGGGLLAMTDAAEDTGTLTATGTVSDGSEESKTVVVLVDLAGKHARRIWPQ